MYEEFQFKLPDNMLSRMCIWTTIYMVEKKKIHVRVM